MDEDAWDAAAEIDREVHGSTARPVNVFTRPRGCRFALTYGEADWVRNVLEAGGGLLESRGRVARFVDPVLVEDAGLRDFPPVVRWILRRIDVNQVLLVDEA